MRIYDNYRVFLEASVIDLKLAQVQLFKLKKDNSLQKNRALSLKNTIIIVYF